MGGGESKPAPRPRPRTPPPSPLLSSPWRDVDWWSQKDLDYVKNYDPQRHGVQHLRVLLYGPVGAGKSSFINSVSNLLRGQMGTPAGVGGIQVDHSFTRKYQTHRIRRNPDSHYGLVFNDIMGLENDGGQGIHVEDIKLAMMGHVSEGHKFNPVSPLTPRDSGYNSSPSLGDKVHILVCICPGNTSNLRAVQKMQEIREVANDLGVPTLVVLTKFDEFCGETQKNLRNIYKSKIVKKKISDISTELGVPVNIVLPVKNYSEEISCQQDVDTLILCALKLIVNLGDDFLDKM